MSYASPSEPKLILVADDDPDIRSLVTGAIEMLGHSVVQAVDGAQALSMFEQMVPDLVVLDVMMPHVSGTDVCRRIKEDQRGQFTPVLLLTARDTVRDKVEALEDGADDYITKPFHYQELQARIKAWLRVRELNENLSRQHHQLQEMQERLIKQERQVVVSQLAGTAAHQLGQPLSAILLNCHLLEHLSPTDERFMKAVHAIKSDAERMASLIQKLRAVDADSQERYSGKMSILDLNKKDEDVE